MTSIKAKANISTILLVGLCMPAYYKTKLVLEGEITWPQAFDFLGLLETIYAFLLAGLLVSFHRWVQRSSVKNHPKHVAVTLLTWCVGALIAFLFTRFYFSTLLGMSIQPSFEFDIAVLSLCLPLILSGVGDRIFLQFQSQALALQAEKQKKEAIAARFEVLKTRLSPHFLFNSLNTLADIIEQEPQLALHFVEHMATTYRYILDHKDKPMVPLVDELQSIEALLFILQIRHDKTLRINLQDYDRLMPQGKLDMIAPLTLHELIENALKHNKHSMEQPLCIKIYRQNDCIVVENSINKRLASHSHRSGLENLEQRIEHVFARGINVTQDERAFQVSIPLQLQTNSK